MNVEGEADQGQASEAIYLSILMVACPCSSTLHLLSLRLFPLRLPQRRLPDPPMHLIIHSQHQLPIHTTHSLHSEKHQSMTPVRSTAVRVPDTSAGPPDLRQDGFHKGARAGDQQTCTSDLGHGGRDEVGVDEMDGDA